MRLFIAVNFNNSTKDKLLFLCDELRSHSERGRFSLPENLHLTLAFLGECNPKQTTAAKSAMDYMNFKALDITIENMGRFKRDGGEIWWAGIAENQTLIELQWSLTDNLNSAGFSLEKRKYSPHITLAREVVTDLQPQGIEPFGETVSSVELMKSEQIGGKLTYTPIYQKTAD